MTDLLKEEKNTYQKNKEQLLIDYEGKYVLIHKDKIIDVFSNQEDAIKEGYQKIGNKPFLVRQILRIEPKLNFTSILIGQVECLM